MTSIRFLWNDGIWEFCAVKQQQKKDTERDRALQFPQNHNLHQGEQREENKRPLIRMSSHYIRGHEAMTNKN